MMIRRPTWIMLLIFALIAGGALVWQRTKKEPAVEASPTLQPRAFSFEADVIQELQLDDGTQTAVYTKQADGTWLLMGNPPAQADSAQVTQRLSNLTQARALTLLPTPPADSVTGLDKPLVRLTLTLNNNTVFRLFAGAATATGSGYYARAETGQVMVLSKSVVDGITGLLQSPPLVTPTPVPEQTAEPDATQSTPAP